MSSCDRGGTCAWRRYTCGSGTGAYRDVYEAAEKIVKVKETILPDEEIAGRYEKKYQQFKKIYPALKPVFDEFD